MAPNKSLPKTPEEAKLLGNYSMLDYFSFPKKRGRSKKASSKAGRKKSNNNGSNEDSNVNQPSIVDEEEIAKKVIHRTNWSEGNNLIILENAVAEWYAHPSSASLRNFAKSKQIPFTTFQRRVNDKHPIAVHARPGRPALISKEDGQFMVDVLRRKDRANDGEGVGGAVELLEQMRPDLSRQQISNAIARTIRPKHKKELTNLRVTQQTTTKRSAITPEQQFRWQKVRDVCVYILIFNSSLIILCLHFRRLIQRTICCLRSTSPRMELSIRTFKITLLW